jgi:hypothetical protein
MDNGIPFSAIGIMDRLRFVGEGARNWGLAGRAKTAALVVARGFEPTNRTERDLAVSRGAVSHEAKPARTFHPRRRSAGFIPRRHPGSMPVASRPQIPSAYQANGSTMSATVPNNPQPETGFPGCTNIAPFKLATPL